jgi:hypothetical protein
MGLCEVSGCHRSATLSRLRGLTADIDDEEVESRFELNGEAAPLDHNSLFARCANRPGLMLSFCSVSDAKLSSAPKMKLLHSSSLLSRLCV